MHANRAEAAAFAAHGAPDTIVVNDDFAGHWVTLYVAKLTLVHTFRHHTIMTILWYFREAIFDLARPQSVRAMPVFAGRITPVAFDTEVHALELDTTRKSKPFLH